MRIPCRLALLTVAACLALLPGCGGDDDGATPSIDADPNAPDADPNASDADPNQPDSGGGGTAGEVPCGDVPTCTSPEGCCVTGKGGGDEECTAQEDCMEGIFQGCDGRNDCTGDDYCCLSGGGVICVGAGDCSIALCSTPDDCPEEGDMCCMDEGGGGSGVCAADCTPK